MTLLNENNQLEEELDKQKQAFKDVKDEFEEDKENIQVGHIRIFNWVKAKYEEELLEKDNQMKDLENDLKE